jgi:hypothetical protein
MIDNQSAGGFIDNPPDICKARIALMDYSYPDFFDFKKWGEGMRPVPPF